MRSLSVFLITLFIVAGAQAQRGRGIGAGASLGGGVGANTGNLGAGLGTRTEAGANIATPTVSASTRANSSTRMSTDGSSAGLAQQLATHAQLSSRISPLLPASTSVTQASAGFKNVGSFVSTVHVSHNLGIPFDQLKAKVVAGESLGSAIHDLNANANAKAEVKRAKKQSRDDMDAK